MTTARDHWEARYADSDRIWSGRPNAALVDLVQDLPPGRALDLGCGEGGDALWLAERGWSVTGLDLSETALGRARQEAERRGLAVRFRQADLGADWPTDGPFELVCASFLHSMVELPRTAILRRAGELVAPGGRLAIVTHAAPPPWSRHKHPVHHLPSPEEELVELAFDPEDWIERVVGTRERTASGPDGHEGVLLDGVVLLERRAR